jgi:hypothetical protein
LIWTKQHRGGILGSLEEVEWRLAKEEPRMDAGIRFTTGQGKGVRTIYAYLFFQKVF